MCHAALISPLSGCGPGHVVQVDGRLRGRVDSLYALRGISLYSEYRTLAHNEGSLFLDSSRSFFFSFLFMRIRHLFFQERRLQCSNLRSPSAGYREAARRVCSRYRPTPGVT
jgi:hypothetical protein